MNVECICFLKQASYARYLKQNLIIVVLFKNVIV